MLSLLIGLVILVIPLYPKFPLVGVGGTFVAIRLEDLMLAAIYLIWIVWAVRHRIWRTLTPTQRSILIYLLIGAISIFSAVFLTKTATLNLGVLHALRRVEYMGLFFVAYSWLSNVRKLGFFLRCFLLVSTIVALYGLGQQFFGFPVISTNNSEFSKGLALELGPGARINSTFAGHYDLAAFSIFPLMLILGLIISRAKYRVALSVIGLLSYWAMLLSASRVSFAALFASAILLVFLLRKFKWLPAIVLLAIIGIVGTPQLIGRYRELIVNHLSESFVPRAYAAVEDELPDALKPPAVAEDRSLNIRLKASWPRAIRAFRKNPLLGTGFSSIGLASDNDYLRMIAETGALGFVAFAGIIWRFNKAIWPTVIKPKNETASIFVVTIFCSLIGLLLTAIFIDVFEASKIAIMTWLLLGLAEKAVQLKSE